jgi:hypothetical protein
MFIIINMNMCGKINLCLKIEINKYLEIETIISYHTRQLIANYKNLHLSIHV